MEQQYNKNSKDNMKHKINDKAILSHFKSIKYIK